MKKFTHISDSNVIFEITTEKEPSRISIHSNPGNIY